MAPKKSQGARRRGPTVSLHDFLFGDEEATAEKPNQNITDPSKSSSRKKNTPRNYKPKKPKSTDAKPLMATREASRFRDNSSTNDGKPAMCALGCVEESNQQIPINGHLTSQEAAPGGNSNIQQFTESQAHNALVAGLSKLMAEIATEAVIYSDSYDQPTMGSSQPKPRRRRRRNQNQRRGGAGRRVWPLSMQDGFMPPNIRRMPGNFPQPRSTLRTQSQLDNEPTYCIDENYNILPSEPSQWKRKHRGGRRRRQRSRRQRHIEETVEMENAFVEPTPPPPPPPPPSAPLACPCGCQDIAPEPASSSESQNLLVVPVDEYVTATGGFKKVTIQMLVTPRRIDVPEHVTTSLVLYHPETGEIAARNDNDNVSHCGGNRLECEWFNSLGKVQPIHIEMWRRPGQILPQFLVPKTEGNYIPYCRIPGEMFSFQPAPEVPESAINPNQDYHAKPGTGFYYPEPEQVGPGQQRTVRVQPRFDCTQSAFIFKPIHAE
ncbi:uncharacterized protein LOC117903392 [Drosophila subobscura]|uniref:uncharacterized protein LOC117903392 n=1 Tax=Drosophila subobscura TaxID=7241 RepID=UPI00155B2087|nr:uncharacterized protein LOC117903392 [Drosophila subobscura]